MTKTTNEGVKSAPKKTQKSKLTEHYQAENIPLTPTEEVPHDEPKNETGVALMTAEQMAEKEVARFDKPRAWIAERKELYKDLTIAGVDDKEGAKKVKEAWQEIRNKRLAVAGKHKEIKGDYLVITRAVDKEKNELTELLEEIEQPLKNEMDRIESIKEEEKQRVIREAEEKLHGRVTELLDSGMKYDGRFYAIGETISMDVVTLKSMSDEDFATLLKKVSDTNQAIIDAENKRLEEERLAAQQVEDQRLENEKKQQELDQQMEAMKKEKRDSRMEVLLALGYKIHEKSGVVFYTCGSEFFYLNFEHDVADYTAESWKEFTTKAKEELVRIDQAAKDKEEEKKAQEKKAQEEEEVKRLIKLREGQLEGLFNIKKVSDSILSRASNFEGCPVVSVEYSLLSQYSNDDWDNYIQVIRMEVEDAIEKEEEERQRVELKNEEERLATLTDKQKAYEWLQGFASLMASLPVVDSAPIKNALSEFDNSLAVIMETLTDKLDQTEKI